MKRQLALRTALATVLPLLLPLLLLLLRIPSTSGCTCMIATKGACQDGHAIVTYAADSHLLYGYLQHWPRATHPANATRDVYDWDGHQFLGVIPEAAETYNVIGNVNEWGLAITESTWGGCVYVAECMD